MGVVQLPGMLDYEEHQLDSLVVLTEDCRALSVHNYTYHVYNGVVISTLLLSHVSKCSFKCTKSQYNGNFQ